VHNYQTETNVITNRKYKCTNHFSERLKKHRSRIVYLGYLTANLVQTKQKKFFFVKIPKGAPLVISKNRF